MLKTQRLILREWKESDRAPFAIINACPLVCQYLPDTLNAQESNAMVDKIIRKFEQDGFCFYAIEHKESGDFIGFCGLNKPGFNTDFTPCVEIGWRLLSQHWNRGYATEAAKAALNDGFNRLKLKEIIAFTVPDNTPSRRVMEKIGLQHDKAGDFDHPALPDGHALQRHVLYKISV